MKRLWVIGASSDGIGRKIANMAEDREWYDNIWATGVEDVDVTCEVEVGKFVTAHGPFDHVVFSAGVNSLRGIDSEDMDHLEETFAVNVHGFINVMSALSRRYENQVRVLAITSDAGWVPMRGSIAYCASKAALNQAVRVAARELAPRFIVNGLAPSGVEDTDMSRRIDEEVLMYRGWTKKEAEQYCNSLIPLGRRARAEEIAEMALNILVGPEYLTGSIIPITGGK